MFLNKENIFFSVKQACLVGRVFTWSHTVSGGPGFDKCQCLLTVMRKRTALLLIVNVLCVRIKILKVIFKLVCGPVCQASVDDYMIINRISIGK